MSAMRHWIARVRIGNAIGEREHVIRDEAEAEFHRAAGWQVEGPFVPEQPRGAVEALRLLCTPVAGATPEDCEAETQRRWNVAKAVLESHDERGQG